jgi:ring-1,2-phenylacetyl-CoA epoxidase subunit PaaD
MVSLTSTEAPQTPMEAQAEAWSIAAAVVDPEIPVLTIEDLGVLREVRVSGRAVSVVLTPTYSGCPAIDAMRDDVVTVLTQHGWGPVDVTFALSPAWTTDWMSEEGKAKLRAYGIAAPSGSAPAPNAGPVRLQLSVKCPRCASLRTRELARFGSTSCKALYECLDCLEPFDYFKVL